MSELLAISFDSEASPAISLRPWRPAATPSGWGFGWYPQGESGAAVVKDPLPTGDTPMSRVLRDWEHFRGSLFLCHIRGAAKRSSQQDTHPFARPFAGRDWLLAHAGDLDPTDVRNLPLGDPPLFEPVGRTDSEHAFCWLLLQIRQLGARTLDEVGWPTLHALIKKLDGLGTINLLLSDGRHLVAYSDDEGQGALHYARRTPPHRELVLQNSAVKVDLRDPIDVNRTALLIASHPLAGEDAEAAPWQELAPGALLVVRRGAIVFHSAQPGQLPVVPPHGGVSSLPAHAAEAGRPTILEPELEQAGSQRRRRPPTAGVDVLQEGAGEGDTPLLPRASKPEALTLGSTGLARLNTTPFHGDRVLAVEHKTLYRYEEEVERSTHVLRLRPVHDVGQQVIDFDLQMEPSGQMLQFEDVFGNHVVRVKLRTSYTELKITSRSRVHVVPREEPRSPSRRYSLPLLWMPWQRQMMLPYLLPPELPEAQLRELSAFAMSFAERQDFDLMETLADINATIFHDFAYVPQSTTIETTPFDVYVQRRGVCQDFANLFICLARLLGVPARYRVGYIHTGANYANKLQSEASHAWLELYLPFVGWRGFDPTNGCLANQDHVRVAAGRNYRDATPTSGTIFKGGKGETLEVSVKVTAGH